MNDQKIRFQILRLLFCGSTKTLACPMLQPLKMPLGKVFRATEFDEVESWMALVAVAVVAVSAWWPPVARPFAKVFERISEQFFSCCTDGLVL